jgi:hypothetical protein
MTQAYKKAKAEDESLFGAKAGGSPTTVVTKKKKRSLIREQYYEEFSTEFWKEPGICTVWLFFCVICVYFDKSRIFTLKYLLFLGTQRNLRNLSSSSNTPNRSKPSRIPRPMSSSATASKIPRAIPSPNKSRPTTPAVSRPPSRPVTPSFSQNAETISFFINYIEPDDQE